MINLTRRALLGAGGAALGAWAVGAPSVPASAAPADGAVFGTTGGVIPGTTASPGSDGTLPTSAWDGAVELTDFATFYQGVGVDMVTAGLLAGPDHLHLRVRIEAPVEDRPAQLEVLFRAPVSRDTFRLTVPVRSVSPSLTGLWGDGVRTFSSVTPVVTDTGSDWIAEVAIRYSAFGQATGTTGDEWRLNVIGLHEVGVAPAWSWSPIRGARASDTNQATITVVAPVAEEDRLGSLCLRALPTAFGEPWHPESVRVNGINYGSLTIALTAPGTVTTTMIAWRAPNGSWQEVRDPRTSQDSDTLTIDIAHPPMVVAGQHSVRITVTTAVGTHTTIVGVDRETALRSVATHTSSVTGARAPVATGPTAASDDLRALVPDRVGMNFCGLPENPGLRPERVFRFDPETPDVLHTDAGSLTYPNEEYPEDRSITVPVGETTVSYPYHEDGDARRYFFSAHLWYLQRQHLLAALPDLAATDPAGTARILYDLALAYQTWVPTCDYLWLNYPVAPTSGPPYPSYGGMWARWSKSDLWDFRFLLPAFETVRHTTALDDLSATVGVDVEKYLVEQMLLPSVRFVDTFPTDHYNYANWLGLGLIGRSIADPDLLHRTVELVTDFYAGDFLFDGFHQLQTFSYHVQLINGTAQVLDAVQGWTDPEGYESPRSGQRYVDLDVGQQLPTVGLAERLPHRLIYPNGRALPIQDTWPSDTPDDPVIDSGSWLLPASGIARLARQDDDVDVATAYLEFHPKYLGHAHRDSLNLVLFDHGQELLPDLGYSHTNYRMWTRSQLAHNTVVVDSTDMSVPDSVHHGGSVRTMAIGDGVQVAAARMSAYEQATTYEREVLAIAVPGQAHNYYVDVFRVAGGERHEYTFNGDANAEATISTDLTTEPYGDHLLPAGVTVTPPQSATDPGDAEGHYYGYIYVQDVERAVPGEGTARLDVTTAASFPGEAHGTSLNVHLLTTATDELFLGRSQCLRATRIDGRAGDTNDIAEISPGEPRYTMPKVVLRRDRGVRRTPERGARPEVPELVSQFRTVFEPVPAGADAAVVGVEALAVTEGPADSVALTVSFASGTTHTVLSNPAGGAMTAAGCTLVGRHAVVETDTDGVSRLWLADGSSLSAGTVTLEPGHQVEGSLIGSLRRAQGDDRNALVVSGQLGDWVVGNHVIVTHPDGSTHGYAITGVAVDGANSILDLGDSEPGLVGTAETGFVLSSFPRTTWEGQHTVTIATVDVWSRP